MKTLSTACAFLLITLSCPFVSSNEYLDLFDIIEALSIKRHGYTLGAELTSDQQAFARSNSEKSSAENLIKFRDKTLYIVAEKSSMRILLMYEQYDSISQKQVQDIVGDLFLAYDEPTVSAHDKVVYWAWGKKEKYTTAQFNMAKDAKKPLEIMATVKLNSEIKIMDKSHAGVTGDAYYIISCDPVLKFFQDQKHQK